MAKSTSGSSARNRMVKSSRRGSPGETASGNSSLEFSTPDVAQMPARMKKWWLENLLIITGPIIHARIRTSNCSFSSLPRGIRCWFNHTQNWWAWPICVLPGKFENLIWEFVRSCKFYREWMISVRLQDVPLVTISEMVLPFAFMFCFLFDAKTQFLVSIIICKFETDIYFTDKHAFKIHSIGDFCDLSFCVSEFLVTQIIKSGELRTNRFVVYRAI